MKYFVEGPPCLSIICLTRLHLFQASLSNRQIAIPQIFDRHSKSLQSMRSTFLFLSTILRFVFLQMQNQRTCSHLFLLSAFVFLPFVGESPPGHQGISTLKHNWNRYLMRKESPGCLGVALLSFCK